MITSKDSRIALKNLIPGQKYAVQVRAVDAEGVASVWSRKFTFTTVTNDRKPKTPTNVTWEPSANSFTGKWDQVTKDIANDDVDIARYEVELYSESTDRTVIVSVIDAVHPSITFGIDRNRSLFGTAQSDLSMRVRAVSTRGLNSDWSDSLRAANNPPAQVQNFTAKPIVDGIVLTWDANTDEDLAGYRIWVGPDRTVTLSEDTKVFEGDATTYTYFTMTYAMHSFAISAFDEFGIESEPVWVDAEPISPFVWDDTPPEVPTGLAVTRDGTNATVSWDAPATADDSLAGYDIMYIRSADIGTVVGEDPWLLADVKNVRVEEGTTTMIQNLDPVAAYQFKIRAYDVNMNTSAFSAEVERSGTPNVPPATPTGLALSVSGQTITAIWDRNSEEDVTNYVLEVDRVNTFNGAFKRTYSVSQTPVGVSPLQEIPKLLENTQHHVRLSAVDRYNDASAWTTVASATTGLDAPPPTDGDAPASAPTISLTSGIGYVVLDWDAVANADPVTYEVHIGTAASFVPDATTLALKTSSTGAFLRNTPAGSALAYGTTYYFKVIPTDGDGAGPVSNEVSGSPAQAGENDIIALNAGVINTGTLDAAVITLGAGGEIKSNNYTATTGFRLTENSLTINDGTVSAAVLKGGTVTSTTITVGSGGSLVIDSTAVIKSSNYAAGSTGWQLSSSGLEINNGSVSASALKGGTLSAGIIYVASGGGIQDANGYWSIGLNGINISNGSINAGTITSGTLRSSQYAVNADGSTNSNYWAWSFDTAGNAVLGNTYVRGRLLVDSGVIQSGNYYAGSSGWRIDSGGQVYFNNATINAGLFKSQNSSQRVEVGDTGYGDPVDEIRMFNSGYVSSMRNLTGYYGSVYFSMSSSNGSGAIKLMPTSDGWVGIQRGTAGPILKLVGSSVQARNSSDSGYVDFVGNNISASSMSKFKKNITPAAINTKAVLRTTGLSTWNWTDDFAGVNAIIAQDVEEFVEPEPGETIESARKKAKAKKDEAVARAKELTKKEQYGLIADDLPVWMQTEDGYSINVVLAFLWESLKQSNERIEALENKLPGRA